MLTISLACEAVKNGTMTVQDAAIELDSVSQLQKMDRKKKGVTYTPWDVALRVVAEADPKPTEHWLDSSIGRGIFLWATLEYMGQKGASLVEIEDFLLHRIHGVELDPAAANDTVSLLSAWCTFMGIQSPMTSWLVQGDSLQCRIPRIDVMVGNPPYVRIQHLDSSTRDYMRAQFNSCASGNVDLYYAFFEQALCCAKRGALIAPNSWLSNNSAATLRRLLAPRTTKVIDFYQHLLFAPIRAYTAVWVWNEASLCGPSVVRQDGLSGMSTSQSRQILKDSMGAPWRDPLRVPILQSASMTPLHKLATVHSGIATLADKIYGVRLISQDATTNMWNCTMFDGTVRALESAILVPLYKWTKDTVASGLLSPGSRAIIYPYHANGKSWSEQDLQKDAPSALAYLSTQKTALAKRDKGCGNYDTWFAYGRRQGLHTAHASALGLSTMWSGPTTAVVIGNTSIPYVFVSGFVLQPLPGTDIARLQKALSHSDVWEQVQARGKMWAGDKPYRTLGAPLLRSLCVPY